MIVSKNDITTTFNSDAIYVPSSLSELHDFLMSMIGGAPTFADPFRSDSHRNIDTEFYALTEGFGVVHKKLGEERYAAVIDLAARAKALFVDDREETNGKTMQGIELIYEMMEIVQSVRRRRVAARQPDEDGDVTGD